MTVSGYIKGLENIAAIYYIGIEFIFHLVWPSKTPVFSASGPQNHWQGNLIKSTSICVPSNLCLKLCFPFYCLTRIIKYYLNPSSLKSHVKSFSKNKFSFLLKVVSKPICSTLKTQCKTTCEKCFIIHSIISYQNWIL